MRRKVIQIAGSTMLVSLPRKWAQHHNVLKGDELEITEQGNKILVSTDKTISLGKLEVDVTGLDRDSLMFLIRALYKNGYDEVVVSFKNQMCDNLRTGEKEKTLAVIAREVSRLNGVEIFTQKEDFCVIRSISEDSMKVFDNMLRRIFLLASETIGDLIEGYEKGSPALLATIQGKHDSITKFVTYSQRLLNKIGYQDNKRTVILYHILEVIDTIMDFIKYNARILLKNKIKPSKECIELCRDIHKSFDMFHTFYYNFDAKKVAELNHNRYKILEKAIAYQSKIGKGEFLILSNMEQILEYILNLTNSRISLEY